MIDTNVHPKDDLWYALDNNPPKSFKPEDVKDIVVEVPGENDEFSWWWILKLGTRKYILVSGWCDYTGWDCQSRITEYPIHSSPLIAANDAPAKEEYSNRIIRECLIQQIKGKQPKFTYWGD